MWRAKGRNERMGEPAEIEAPTLAGTSGAGLESWSRKFLIGYAACQGTALALHVASSAASTTELGFRVKSSIEFLVLLFLCLLPPFAALPVLVFAVRAKPPRRWTWALAAALLISVPMWAGAIRLASTFRTRDFERLAERSKPLVAAIHAYEKDRGQPPPKLAALAPDYLPSVPGTGMSAYPEYLYFVGEEAAKNWYGNPWVLYVSASEGIMDFSFFYFLPMRHCPVERAPERIRDWGYLHE